MFTSLRDRIFLLRDLTLRDLRLRYVGSIMGLFWSVVHPIFTLLLYTLVFSQVIRPNWSQLQTIGSFASYLFAGLLPWIQFHESITRCATVFIDHSNLIKKVKFPVELLPGSMVLSSIANQLIALCVFLALLLLSYHNASLSLFWLVPAIALQMLVTVGAGLLVASSNVFVRDIHQLLGVGLPFLFWATPIVYPPASVPARYQWISAANPLTHLVALYRAALLGGQAPETAALLYLSLFCAATFAAGWALLCRIRGVLSDYV
ncbi:MAG: ABC transporter permease [Acidobacteria bacterium]|nr:ABC transporter permease [Acidobacteriota bacterium]